MNDVTITRGHIIKHSEAEDRFHTEVNVGQFIAWFGWGGGVGMPATFGSHETEEAAIAEALETCKDQSIDVSAEGFYIEVDRVVPDEVDVDSLSADEIIRFLQDLLPQAEGGSAFLSLGKALLRGVVDALVYLRDHHDEYMSFGVIRTSLSLEFIEKCLGDSRLPEQATQGLKAFAESIRFGNLPPSQSTYEQFQYAAMYLTGTLKSLVETYGAR